MSVQYHFFFLIPSRCFHHLEVSRFTFSPGLLSVFAARCPVSVRPANYPELSSDRTRWPSGKGLGAAHECECSGGGSAYIGSAKLAAVLVYEAPVGQGHLRNAF